MRAVAPICGIYHGNRVRVIHHKVLRYIGAYPCQSVIANHFSRYFACMRTCIIYSSLAQSGFKCKYLFSIFVIIWISRFYIWLVSPPFLRSYMIFLSVKLILYRDQLKFFNSNSYFYVCNLNHSIYKYDFRDEVRKIRIIIK